MAQRILIDGYNLVAELWGMGRGTTELARQRADLVALVGRHGRGRGHRVEVVFDGWREGQPFGGSERASGVDVTFSPKGVTADEVIRDRLRARGPGVLVVTSDGEVRRWAHAAGADVVDAATFARLLERPAPAAPPGKEPDPDDRDEGWRGDTVKKGNPRKAKKRDRALRRRLGKL